jgi:hypothetical protein
MQWTRGSFVIDDDRTRLDMPLIMGWLSESYWAGWRHPTRFAHPGMPPLSCSACTTARS